MIYQLVPIMILVAFLQKTAKCAKLRKETDLQQEKI